MLLIHFITYCTYCIASMSMETPQILFTVIAKSSQCKQCELHSTINENNSSRKLCEESGHVKFLRRSLPLIIPHAQRERGKVIGCGVHIYIYVCGRKKNLNRTLEIDSPFQRFAVGLLVEFID